jgi:multicomponent Na+:H+ antiporter subunit D
VMLCIPVAILAAMTLTIGFYTEPFFLLAEAAADQLLNPNIYIQAVLGR